MEPNKPKTINDFKAEFYDLQRAQANILELMVSEVVALNDKMAKAVAPKGDKKK